MEIINKYSRRPSNRRPHGHFKAPEDGAHPQLAQISLPPLATGEIEVPGFFRQ
jgi:hypothetical protein